MAKIIKKVNHLSKDIVVGYIIIFFSIVLGIISIYNSFYNRYFLFVPLVVAVIIRFAYKKIKIYSYGLKGEKEVLKSLRKLPKGYTVVTDIKITDKDKSSQIDFAVVCNKGVFLIESKHVKGEINGDENSMYLEKTKTTKNNKKYIQKMFNPIIQVLGHKKGLRKYLDKNGINTNIIPIIYFSNYSKMNTDTQRVMIINDEKSLMNYIKDYSVEKHINSYEQRKIIKTLKSSK